MDTNRITAFVVVAVALACIVGLVLVSYPPKPRVRIRLEGDAFIKCKMPPICVITGEPATETRIVRGYTFDPWTLTRFELELPFSKRGVQEYKARLPISLTIYKAVLYVASRVPLIGPFFVIYCWSIWSVIPCGLLSFVDLALGRRQLVRIEKTGFTTPRRILWSVRFMVPSKDFADAFYQVNGQQPRLGIVRRFQAWFGSVLSWRRTSHNP